MIRSDLKTVSAGLFAIGTALIITSVGASAQTDNPYDGVWKVDFDVDKGNTCFIPPLWRYHLRIDQGSLEPANIDPAVKIFGWVDEQGHLEASAERPGEQATGSGKLSGSSGEGTWSSTGKRICTGTWKAKKKKL